MQILEILNTIFLFIASLLTISVPITSSDQFKVNKITDGDTYVINGDTYRVLCIDFPDLDSTRIQKWLNMGISQEIIEKCYQEGNNKLKTMILNQNVTLYYDENNRIDKYDRKLAYVYLGTTDIGLWLIQNGYAIQEYSPCSKENQYQIYEEKAKLEKSGCLWQTTLK